MDIGDLFPESKTGMFDFGTPMKVSRLIYQLINRFETFEERYEILKNSAEYFRIKYIYTFVQKIAIENQVHGKYGLAESSRP